MNKIILIFILIVSTGSGNKIPDLDSLTLREKIAQMIMVRVRGDFYNSKSWYKEKLKKWIKKDGIGGLITFGGSVHGTFYNNKMFQNWAKYPLLISADYERGAGQWLGNSTLFPTNMAFAATNNPQFAYDAGFITANEATALGVHIILGPVLDINNNPKNPIINFRAYSDSPKIVSEYGIQFIAGIQDGGRIACAKHFPGHGNTATDSHTSLPTIEGTREILEKNELSPFKKAVESNVGSIMTAHISVPGLDSNRNPASHSWRISTGILKNEWGFKGLVITDGMEMGGLTESAWAGESAVLAIEAGADILLLPVDVDKTIETIEMAIKNGRLTESRINHSVKKILSTKEELGIFENRIPSWEVVESSVGLPENMNIAQKIANESITLVKDDDNLIPLLPEKIEELIHVIISTDDGIKDKLKTFINDINYTHGNVKEVLINQKLKSYQIDNIINDMKSNSSPILVSALVRIRMDKGEATIDLTHNEFLKKLDENNISYILASFGSPYLPSYDHISTYLCAYGYGSISLKAMANAIWGRIPIRGKLPINLDEKLLKGTGIYKAKRKYGFGKNSDYDLSPISNIVENLIFEKVFPSAQLFVVKDGNILLNNGFGNYTYENKSPPVNTKSIYDIASLTKVISTTPIVMKLVSQKKIALNQKVKHFFPHFAGPQKDKVTIKHLLTHSSGIEPYFEYFLENPIKSKHEIINDIIQKKLIYNPGEYTKYSDLGIILLGAIIEKVQNYNLEELSKKYVFNSFEMKSTMYNPDMRLYKKIVPTEIDNRFRKKMIQGVVHDENAYILGGIAPHAGVFSTAEDIGNYFQMLLNEGTWLGKRYYEKLIIKEFTTKQNTPLNTDRAIGFDTPTLNDKSSAGDYFSKNSFGHLGFTGTSVWADKEKNIIIILLTNRVYPNREKKGIYQARRKIYNSIMEVLVPN
ncbi:MAG: hypothetical protein CMF96_09075 [Candidatus Marinimicrobia bacterium]|nr:hypothetical protein [Candidatus Neomarinimicrobiota bacterium]